MTNSAHTTLRRRALVNTVLIAGALTLGLGVAFGFHVLTDRRPGATVAGANVHRHAGGHRLASQGGTGGDNGAVLPTSQTDAAASADAPDAPTSSPDDAVRRFLDFEVPHHDYEASYGLLSADNHAQAATRAGWSAAHADLPAITGYALGPAEVHERPHRRAG